MVHSLSATKQQSTTIINNQIFRGNSFFGRNIESELKLQIHGIEWSLDGGESERSAAQVQHKYRIFDCQSAQNSGVL